MASTRSASPASDGGTPEPLTPRSKIKQLLAAVDSSDDEQTTGTKSKSTARQSKQTSPANGSLPRPTVPSQLSDDSEESDVEVKPRGRLAARMHGVAPQAKQAPASATPTVAVEQEEVQKDVEMANAIADDDDEDLPVLNRRLHRKSSPRPAAERSPSPGLFVSSPAQPSPTKSIPPPSDSENELPATKSDRFKALVERKKQERLAREAAEEARKAERRAALEERSQELEQLDSDANDHPSDITDDEGGRKLTQEARPTRKASKKAIEEMNRETQRMARSMQLAHEAKTRKKISKNSLLERFNFKPVGVPEPKTTSSSRPGTPTSDVDMQDAETPPSSPPVNNGMEKAELQQQTENVSGDLLSLDELNARATQKLDKGKGKAVDTATAPKPKRQVRVRLPNLAVNHVDLDSDEELEVTTTEKDKLMALFDHVPKNTARESHSLQALRALAQVRSPGKEKKRKGEVTGISASELQFQLHQKARQQAKVERDRRLDVLKAQGVVVQTAEERERQMQEVEDIVAKARKEAQDIMEQERADAKKNKDGQENDPLAWDDSEDDDYEDRGNDADAEVSAVELSGSEDEEEEEDGDASDAEDAGNPMFDEDAEDGLSEASEEVAEEDASNQDEDEDELPAPVKRRARKQAAVISDDEAEEADVEATPRPKSAIQATPTVPSSATPKAPSSVLRSAKKSFIPGMPVQGPAGLGLTQIFAGTMDESQMSPSQAAPTQSMMPDFDNFPDSNFSATMDEADDNLAPATQMEETQGPSQAVQLNLSQTQMHGLDSLMRDVPGSQISDIIEPSQDGGFQEHTPLRERFVDPPYSTVDTVVLGQEEVDQQDSPLVRRGRLRRKIDASAPEKDAPPTAIVDGTPEPQAAFDVLKKAAAKEQKMRNMEEFNRKKSKAKEMVEEDAEESEDEYQGLGGYDGEDSDDESTASVKDMIDDAAENNVDERKLAAFYADRERANDEQQVEQLFKDITNGMLRRKRGADYDLSDSDDGGEARRKMKRRQFAKMQKALFSDERVKKMAENPGNQAFLKTIEDRGSDDEMDFLDVVEEPAEQSSESQSQTPSQDQGSTPQQQVVPDSQPRAALSDAQENRAPAAARRTKNGKKPSNIGEVRQTLSNLLEDEREASVIPATEAGSDSEEEQAPPSPALSDKENRAPNPRRSGSGVVDRISLKRNNSSNISTSSTSRLAFTGAANNGSSSFKVPALLRRATTNSLMSTSSTSSSGSSKATGSAGGFGEDAKIKKAASKKSGVNAFARGNDRRSKINESERKRQEKKARGAERRVGMVGGLLGKGSFE